MNLQCDLDHPTQSMADLMHLQKTFGSLENLRGKKIAMTWAYSPSYGKPLSVPQAIITLMTRFRNAGHPGASAGIRLVPETLATAQRHAQESGGSFTHTHSMEEAFRDADIVYPKSWARSTSMQQRTQAAAQRRSRTSSRTWRRKRWPTTRDSRIGNAPTKLMRARQGRQRRCTCTASRPIFTDVSCQEGEVAASVFERYRLADVPRGVHKPFMIAAMMLMTRFEKPGKVLREI